MVFPDHNHILFEIESIWDAKNELRKLNISKDTVFTIEIYHLYLKITQMCLLKSRLRILKSMY